MVTHSTTHLPIWCLSMAERTGCPVLTSLWSYVLEEVALVSQNWRTDDESTTKINPEDDKRDHKSSTCDESTTKSNPNDNKMDRSNMAERTRKMAKWIAKAKNIQQ